MKRITRNILLYPKHTRDIHVVRGSSVICVETRPHPWKERHVKGNKRTRGVVFTSITYKRRRVRTYSCALETNVQQAVDKRSPIFLLIIYDINQGKKSNEILHVFTCRKASNENCYAGESSTTLLAGEIFERLLPAFLCRRCRWSGPPFQPPLIGRIGEAALGPLKWFCALGSAPWRRGWRRRWCAAAEGTP